MNLHMPSMITIIGSIIYLCFFSLFVKSESCFSKIRVKASRHNHFCITRANNGRIVLARCDSIRSEWQWGNKIKHLNGKCMAIN
eukprot:Pgem_evm1s19297